MSFSLSVRRPIRVAPLIGKPVRNWILSPVWIAALFIAHALLALLMSRVHIIGMLHVAATLIVGLYWAMSGRRYLIHVAYAGAYITGAEVLWRMAHAPVPWEIGKYAVVTIFVVALLRSGLIRIPAIALLFFVMLLISVPLTVMHEGDVETKALISSYLSPPLALMCCAWFFSHLKLSTERLQGLFLALIIPIIGIAAITLFAGLTTANINFGTESNKVTSGGFGPNQVSAILGLGAFLALFFILIGRTTSRWLKALMFGVVLFLAVQSAMTFSRGGLYMAAGATLLGAVYLSRDRRTRAQIVLAAVVLFVVANYILLPRLDAFTKGALTARFQNTNVTGRDDLVRNELLLWKKNLLLGVGPGMAQYYRAPFWVASHTEYTRLLAEHGIPGLVALASLFIMGIQNLKQARTAKSKAVAAAAVGWCFLFMFSVALRTVAPVFMFGLTFATLFPEGHAARRGDAQRRVFRRRLRHPRLAFSQRRIAAAHNYRQA